MIVSPRRITSFLSSACSVRRMSCGPTLSLPYLTAFFPRYVREQSCPSSMGDLTRCAAVAPDPSAHPLTQPPRTSLAVPVDTARAPATGGVWQTGRRPWPHAAPPYIAPPRSRPRAAPTPLHGGMTRAAPPQRLQPPPSRCIPMLMMSRALEPAAVTP
jgi:hypothetical protein